VKPTSSSAEYRVEVTYQPWASPDVRILEPEIAPQSQLHIYKSGGLCLYDWREQPWQRNWHLADTVIPWTAEWLLYYEIYLLTGKWIGKSAVHGDAPNIVEPVSDTEEVLTA